MFENKEKKYYKLVELTCFLEKLDVGAVAVHYRKMTPNYKWMCYDEQKWEHLTKGQQKIVKFVFSKRNDNWYMFDIASMLRL